VVKEFHKTIHYITACRRHKDSENRFYGRVGQLTLHETTLTECSLATLVRGQKKLTEKTRSCLVGRMAGG
jgi:hypothetical protein